MLQSMHFEKMKKYCNLLNNNKKIKINLILIFIILINNIKNSFYSDKWIIMTAFNIPDSSILNILKILKNWKLVVISINNNIDKEWESLNYFNNLIYLSLKKQINLGYNILKFSIIVLILEEI